jgi:hypothetical protein
MSWLRRQRRKRRLIILAAEGRITVLGTTPQSAIDAWRPKDQQVIDCLIGGKPDPEVMRLVDDLMERRAR